MNMKKMFFLAAAVALIVSSCSSDDILSVDKKESAIEFRTVNDEKTTNTRAAITDLTNILSFTVTSYWEAGTTSVSESQYLFNAFDITRGEDSKWSYTPLMYWPTGGSADFYAYSPASSVNLTTGLKNYINGTIAYKVPQIKENNAQEDFLVAKAIGKKEVAGGTPPVPLNFHHALSRIKFFAKTTHEDMTYIVDEIALVNLNEEGTLNLSTLNIPETGSITYPSTVFPSWTPTRNKVSYTADMGKSPIQLVYDEDGKFSSLLGDTNAILVMPQETTLYTGDGTSSPGTDFAIKVSYKAYAGGIYYAGSETQSEVRYFAVPAGSSPITFEMGRQYAFYLIFGDNAGDEINFNVAVQNWDDANNIEL